MNVRDLSFCSLSSTIQFNIKLIQYLLISLITQLNYRRRGYSHTVKKQ